MLGALADTFVTWIYTINKYFTNNHLVESEMKYNNFIIGLFNKKFYDEYNIDWKFTMHDNKLIFSANYNAFTKVYDNPNRNRGRAIGDPLSSSALAEAWCYHNDRRSMSRPRDRYIINETHTLFGILENYYLMYDNKLPRNYKGKQCWDSFSQ